MFEDTVEQWIRELIRDGKLPQLEDNQKKELAEEYTRKLEEFFHKEVIKQLEPSGKAAEFERMMIYDTQYIYKYLNQSIPGYAGFLANVLSRAKKAILGN